MASFRWIIQLHRDVPRAARFYSEGLDFRVNICTLRWAELQSGPLKLGLMQSNKTLLGPSFTHPLLLLYNLLKIWLLVGTSRQRVKQSHLVDLTLEETHLADPYLGGNLVSGHWSLQDFPNCEQSDIKYVNVQQNVTFILNGALFSFCCSFENFLCSDPELVNLVRLVNIHDEYFGLSLRPSFERKCLLQRWAGCGWHLKGGGTAWILYFYVKAMEDTCIPCLFDFDGAVQKGYSSLLSFEVPDINSTVTKLISLGAEIDGSIKYEIHGKVAAMRCLDGHVVGLYEPA